jgi:hypothetical protein
MFKLSVHNDIADDNHSRQLFSPTVVITIILAAVALLLSLAALLLFKNMYNTTRAIATALPAIKIPICHPVHQKYNNNMKIHFYVIESLSELTHKSIIYDAIINVFCSGHGRKKISSFYSVD